MNIGAALTGAVRFAGGGGGTAGLRGATGFRAGTVLTERGAMSLGAATCAGLTGSTFGAGAGAGAGGGGATGFGGSGAATGTGTGGGGGAGAGSGGGAGGAGGGGT